MMIGSSRTVSEVSPDRDRVGFDICKRTLSNTPLLVLLPTTKMIDVGDTIEHERAALSQNAFGQINKLHV